MRGHLHGDETRRRHAGGKRQQRSFWCMRKALENPYVAARPFRVNAGAVRAYTRVPGSRTRYLSELAAGDPVLIIDFKGNVAYRHCGTPEN
ncbi:MAG: 3-dehydroquinate synthase II [Desulfobacterales bacterium]